MERSFFFYEHTVGVRKKDVILLYFFRIRKTIFYVRILREVLSIWREVLFQTMMRILSTACILARQIAMFQRYVLTTLLAEEFADDLTRR